MRARLIALTDVLSVLCLCAWIGGHAALGAFAARVAFRELPRGEAGRTMTQVFHEFDRLIWACLVLLLACAVVGVLARGWGRRSQIRLGLELGLCALGVFELSYVHAGIEALFTAGDTLSPRFAALHALSERCAHTEVLMLVACLVVRAWPPAPEASR